MYPSSLPSLRQLLWVSSLAKHLRPVLKRSKEMMSVENCLCRWKLEMTRSSVVRPKKVPPVLHWKCSLSSWAVDGLQCTQNCIGMWTDSGRENNTRSWNQPLIKYTISTLSHTEKKMHGMAVNACNLSTWEFGQKDYHEFNASWPCLKRKSWKTVLEWNFLLWTINSH